jgi:hypothetical protein
MTGRYAGPGDCSGTVAVFIGVVDPGFPVVSVVSVGDVTGLNKGDDG